MRKTSALAALGLLIACAIAHAGTYVWVSDDLKFRTTLANSGTVGVTVDSAVVRNGSTTAQTTYDTTVAFPLRSCEFTDNAMLSGKTAAVDSIPHIAFTFEPTANTNFTAGADSFGVIVQVSVDDINFVTMTPNHVFDATRPADQRAALYIENNATNGVTVLFKNVSLAAYAAGTAFTLDGATAPTDLQWFGWNYVRFIVADCGYTGEFHATIDHWKSIFQ